MTGPLGAVPRRQPRIALDLATLVQRHDYLITSLRTQKAYHNTLFDQCAGKIQEELQLPAHRHSRLTAAIGPIVEEMRAGKLIDWELIKAQARLIEEMVRYNAQFQIPDAALANLELHFDAMVEVVLRLEKALIDQKKDLKEAVLQTHLDVIRRYQEWYPGDPGTRKGYCVYCGAALSPDNPFKGSCLMCNTMPPSSRPYLRVGGYVVKAAASQPTVVETEVVPGSTLHVALPATVQSAPLPKVDPVTAALASASGGPEPKRARARIKSILSKIESTYKDELATLDEEGDEEKTA